MTALHDVLHMIADLLPHASENNRNAMHERINDVPEFIEHLADEQHDAEQPVDEQLVDVTTKENKPS